MLLAFLFCWFMIHVEWRVYSFFASIKFYSSGWCGRNESCSGEDWGNCCSCRKLWPFCFQGFTPPHFSVKRAWPRSILQVRNFFCLFYMCLACKSVDLSSWKAMQWLAFHIISFLLIISFVVWLQTFMRKGVRCIDFFSY